MRRFLTATAMITALLGATAGPAAANQDRPIGGGGGRGDRFDVYVGSLVHIRGSGSRNGKPSVPAHFTPPRCWYQPRFTQTEMYQWVRRIYETWRRTGPEEQDAAREWYEARLAELKPHDGESGKIWWFLTDDGTAEGAACYSRTRPFFKYVGARPPQREGDGIIDPVDLARIARASLRLPKPRITLNPPGGRSFVSLETWVQVQDPRRLFVEASVRGVPGLRATITAVPAKVSIKASGGDPTVQDGRDSCPAYRKGMSEKDGCWVRFNRSSLGKRFTITVTRYWRVTTNVRNVTLPVGVVSASTTVRVDEIQSTVVR